MQNASLKETVLRLLTRVQTPAQYMGGELNSVVKDHRKVRGKLCLAFPDMYTLGMSHHGLQVLYTLMNNDPHNACDASSRPGPISRSSFASVSCRFTASKHSRRCAIST